MITLFVNPVRMRAPANLSEPDDQPIEDWQARSAILFGPPGASKTTIARQAASALGWKYIELHSSHFVAEGIQAIQSTADRIFRYLMELDRAVILFDEPDELVRERDDSPDAFGRFLTTSMLPKLAELWNQRRVIYLIATNHIRYFDAAIVRSGRFDLLALTPPPSFNRKRAEIVARLDKRTGRKIRFAVSRRRIERELLILASEMNPPDNDADESAAPQDRLVEKQIRLLDRHLHTTQEERLKKENQLAKFILLRFDQIDELVFHLEQLVAGKRRALIDLDLLSTALGRIADHRLDLLSTYFHYISDSKQSRRDYQRKPVFELENAPSDALALSGVTRRGDEIWLKCESGVCPLTIGQYTLRRTSTPGVLRLLKNSLPR